jgi:hypothetical protein
MVIKVKDVIKKLQKMDPEAIFVTTTDNFEMGHSTVPAHGISEFSGEWIQGPYMNPQKGRDNIKYKLMDENKFNAQQELIKVLENQVADLSMMSKIELGNDVIDEIKRLKNILK